MLSWESSSNLVASIASFICVISKLEFLRFGRAVHGHRFTGLHSFIAEDVREFEAVKKVADREFSLKFAGDDSAIRISVCVSAHL